MRGHLLIIGGGQAASEMIQTLRQHAFAGAITLVSRERYVPYHRPPLSKKYFSGALTRERLYIRPPEFYSEHDVVLRLNVEAAAIDRQSQVVALSDGSQIGYDHLLLATGSCVTKIHAPGADLAGVHYLRTVGDVDSIQPQISNAKRLVIVGAGYVGLEIAASARSHRLDVVLLEAADRVMSRVVCPAVSSFYHDLHAEAGTQIHYGVTVCGFEGRGRVAAVSTSDGRQFPCDLSIIGIGVTPETDLGIGAGLSCEDGIIVDEFARTSDPRIFAAGDCTRHPNSIYGRRVRLESVHNAIEQARTAAMSLLGRAHPYTQVPWFWSDQFNVKLQIAGLSIGADRIMLRGEPRERSFAVYYLKNEKLVAVDAINSPKDFLKGKRLIAAGERFVSDAIECASMADSGRSSEDCALPPPIKRHKELR